jgi:hypothetical protein
MAVGTVTVAGTDGLTGLEGVVTVLVTAAAGLAGRLGVGTADFTDSVAASFVWFMVEPVVAFAASVNVAAGLFSATSALFFSFMLVGAILVDVACVFAAG